MRFSDLRCKEIINVASGQRLGYVNDAEINFPKGEISALIVPGPCRFFGLFGREPDFLIPMECIRRLGPDVILVEVKGNYGRSKRESKKFYS